MGSRMFEASRYKMEAGFVNIFEGRPDFERSSLDSIQPKPSRKVSSYGSITITSRHW